MPTYEYACAACGNEIEIFQSMKDAPLRKCPKCKRMKLQRRIGTGAGLIFKGSGFYETDYKPKPKEKESAADGTKETKTGEAGSSGTKTASKESAPKKESSGS